MFCCCELGELAVFLMGVAALISGQITLTGEWTTGVPARIAGAIMVLPVLITSFFLLIVGYDDLNTLGVVLFIRIILSGICYLVAAVVVSVNRGSYRRSGLLSFEQGEARREAKRKRRARREGRDEEDEEEPVEVPLARQPERRRRAADEDEPEEVPLAQEPEPRPAGGGIDELEEVPAAGQPEQHRRAEDEEDDPEAKASASSTRLLIALLAAGGVFLFILCGGALVVLIVLLKR